MPHNHHIPNPSTTTFNSIPNPNSLTKSILTRVFLYMVFLQTLISFPNIIFIPTKSVFQSNFHWKNLINSRSCPAPSHLYAFNLRSITCSPTIAFCLSLNLSFSDLIPNSLSFISHVHHHPLNQPIDVLADC